MSILKRIRIAREKLKDERALDATPQAQRDHALIKRVTGHHVQRMPGARSYSVRVAQYRCTRNCLHGSRWIWGQNYTDALHQAAQYVHAAGVACGCREEHPQ